MGGQRWRHIGLWGGAPQCARLLLPPASTPQAPTRRPAALCTCAQALTGARGFLSKARLAKYEKRNDPTLPDALSGLSPWLHFGQLAPQRAAIEATKVKAQAKVGTGVGSTCPLVGMATLLVPECTFRTPLCCFWRASRCTGI